MHFSYLPYLAMHNGLIPSLLLCSLLQRWFFYPPSQDFRVGYHSDLSMLQWYLEEYPLLDDVTRPLECTLEPNQVRAALLL